MSGLRGWSLRRRVVTGSAVGVLLVVVLGVGAFAVTLDHLLVRAAVDATVNESAQAAATIADDDGDGPRAVADLPGKGSLVQLVDASGAVAATTDGAARRPLTSLRPALGREVSYESSTLPGLAAAPYVVVVRGIRDSAGQAFSLVVANPLVVEQRTVRTATTLLAVGGTLLVLVLVLLIHRTVTAALRPVDRIRREVAAIHRVEHPPPVTVPGTHDEIAELARTTNEMLRRLERADATTRQFVSDASHELRSPLTTIRATLEVARAGAARDPGQDALLLAETLRMQHLVDGLLTLAAADDHRLALSAREVDLDDVVGAEVRRVRATATCPVRSRVAAARVLGDPTRLSQVVRNLVDNAVTHTEDWVEVAVATTGDRVRLTVDNAGPPVAEADRERVFERFARLETARERDSGGSGLGLAIARALVEAHGGTVRATATPGGACRFEVDLPSGG